MSDSQNNEIVSVTEVGDAGGLASELSQFVDKDAVIACIIDITTSQLPNKSFQKNFDYLNDTLVKYQEQPILIAPALLEMVEPLTNRMLNLCVLHKVYKHKPQRDCKIIIFQ